MKQIRIETDGTGPNTDIFDANTGEKLMRVLGITWRIDLRAPTCEIEYIPAESRSMDATYFEPVHLVRVDWR